jgi:hypothetical protein
VEELEPPKPRLRAVESPPTTAPVLTAAEPIHSTPPSEPGDPQPAPYREPSAFDVTLAAFTSLGYALSARAILMLAVVGGFVLCVMAVLTAHWQGLVAVGLYAGLIVIPCAILEHRRRGP